jgi:hypothetical protein
MDGPRPPPIVERPDLAVHAVGALSCCGSPVPSVVANGRAVRSAGIADARVAVGSVLTAWPSNVRVCKTGPASSASLRSGCSLRARREVEAGRRANAGNGLSCPSPQAKRVSADVACLKASSSMPRRASPSDRPAAAARIASRSTRSFHAALGRARSTAPCCRSLLRSRRGEVRLHQTVERDPRRPAACRADRCESTARSAVARRIVSGEVPPGADERAGTERHSPDEADGGPYQSALDRTRWDTRQRRP